ncbi:hypothetical protein RhiirC2_469253 [Rhizophagus irregularis]|uniref:Uncharacterized protein n=1 Tax=Rhizophagus irregularis TaxID=588596 RepID=A0A2N1N921_9GLOM|nr:hypothetical protein RhiirC2_469253 [Rhizophagus irregularis]
MACSHQPHPFLVYHDTFPCFEFSISATFILISLICHYKPIKANSHSIPLCFRYFQINLAF